MDKFFRLFFTTLIFLLLSEQNLNLMASQLLTESHKYALSQCSVKIESKRCNEKSTVCWRTACLSPAK